MILEFLQRINYPGHYLFSIRLINDSDNIVDYDLTNLKSTIGINILSVNPNYKINGESLLIKGKLNSLQFIEGLILFIPNNLATDTSMFFYEGQRYKIKLRKE